jgi:hypothetical protein
MSAFRPTPKLEDPSKVTLRLTRSQSVNLDVEFYPGLTITVLFFVERPLWREDGSVFCICCWPLPAQSFSGSSPLGLATIFYFHGRGIRTRLHTGFAWTELQLPFYNLAANWISNTIFNSSFVRCRGYVLAELLNSNWLSRLCWLPRIFVMEPLPGNGYSAFVRCRWYGCYRRVG